MIERPPFQMPEPAITQQDPLPLWAIKGLLKSPYATFAGRNEQPPMMAPSWAGGASMDPSMGGGGGDMTAMNAGNPWNSEVGMGTPASAAGAEPSTASAGPDSAFEAPWMKGGGSR